MKNAIFGTKVLKETDFINFAKFILKIIETKKLHKERQLNLDKIIRKNKRINSKGVKKTKHKQCSKERKGI